MCGVCVEVGETCLKIFELSLDVCQVARGGGGGIRAAVQRTGLREHSVQGVIITLAGVNHKL